MMAGIFLLFVASGIVVASLAYSIGLAPIVVMGGALTAFFYGGRKFLARRQFH